MRQHAVFQGFCVLGLRQGLSFPGFRVQEGGAGFQRFQVEEPELRPEITDSILGSRASVAGAPRFPVAGPTPVDPKAQLPTECEESDSVFRVVVPRRSSRR